MIELREPLNQLIKDPCIFTGGKHFQKKIYIYDETLRDGEQMPGVAFTPNQKLQLARFLSDIGVDVLMAAFPVSSASDREAYTTLLAARKRGEIRKDIELICIARADRRDIDMVASLAKEAGVAMDEVGILVLSTTSDLHMKYKLGRSLLSFKGVSEKEWLDRSVDWYRAANIDLIVDHVAYCKRLGFGTIEFAAEDASRGDRDYLIQWAKECQRAGGTRLCFSDTSGVLTPESVDYYFEGLISELSGLDITAHFHNDFGLGAINTVRALSHGATHASITACGIGERAGNASIHQVVMILKELYGVRLARFKYDRLWELRNIVECFSGIPIQAHEPIIGWNVFSHESGMHTAAIRIHPKIYQFLNHESVGGEHRFIFGKHSGSISIRHTAEIYRGIIGTGPDEFTDGQYEQVLELIKKRREKEALCSDHSDFISRYYSHLKELGIPESFVIEQLKEAVNRFANQIPERKLG